MAKVLSAMEPEREIKFMTYNVWAREDVAVYRRMQAIGGLVEEHDPDVIFFQEVTAYIFKIFQSFDWWRRYNYELSELAGIDDRCFCLLLSRFPLDRIKYFPSSALSLGRFVEARITPWEGMAPIQVVTTHLDRTRANDRFVVAEQILASVEAEANVLVGGDMSWDDDVDMPFPLLHGWLDAWTHLLPRADLASSWTYDRFWNEEVTRFNGYIPLRSSLRKRSDRFVCKLNDYTLRRIELIGSDGVGMWYYNKASLNDVYSLPTGDDVELVPSCHRGLVLTIVQNGEGEVKPERITGNYKYVPRFKRDR